VRRKNQDQKARKSSESGESIESIELKFHSDSMDLQDSPDSLDSWLTKVWQRFTQHVILRHKSLRRQHCHKRASRCGSCGRAVRH